MNDSDSELKPCPFCGGKAHCVYSTPDYILEWIECTECPCQMTFGTYHDDDSEAIEQWNSRAIW